MNPTTVMACVLIAIAVMSVQVTAGPRDKKCVVGDGANYRGEMDFTKSGYQCQGWDDQDPHTHDYNSMKYPNSDLRKNYCRNPDGSDTVWCFTDKLGVRFESCIVDVCEPRCSVDGKEYSPGQTWRSKDCTSDCICYDDGTHKCFPAPLKCPRGSAVQEQGEKCHKCPAPAPAGPCQDESSKACQCWTANPDIGCTKEWVQKKCPVTCKSCPKGTPIPPPSCEDATPACSTDLNGDCGSKAVRTACPQTCKACKTKTPPTPPPTPPPCEDTTPACAKMSKRCGSREVDTKCPATCKKCPPGPPPPCKDAKSGCAKLADQCGSPEVDAACALTCKKCPDAL